MLNDLNEESQKVQSNAPSNCCYDFKWIWILTLWFILTLTGLALGLWWLTKAEDCLTDLCRYGTDNCSQILGTPEAVVQKIKPNEMKFHIIAN